MVVYMMHNINPWYDHCLLSSVWSTYQLSLLLPTFSLKLACEKCLTSKQDNTDKQNGAELCQAQVEIGVEVEACHY